MPRAGARIRSGKFLAVCHTVMHWSQTAAIQQSMRVARRASEARTTHGQRHLQLG